MRKTVVGIPLLLLCLFVLSDSLEAQVGLNFEENSNWLIGYVANPPQQLVGFSTAIIRPEWRGWGLYADARFTIDTPKDDPLDPPITPAEAIELGDLFLTSDSRWTSFNLAAIRALTPEFALYLGAGYSMETRFEQFIDELFERSEFGNYWVEAEDQPVAHPNVIAGALFRMGSRIAVQFGLGTAPAGFTVGGHFRVR